MSKSVKRSNCPISCSLDIWGDKWSLLIVRDLMFKKQSTYGEFLKSGEKIATNILASRLLKLEEQGIILKSEHPDSKAKVLYKLTEKGIDLLPMLVEVNLWAAKHSPDSKGDSSLIQAIEKDKEAFIKSQMQSLRQHL